MHSPLFFIREEVKSVCDYENRPEDGMIDDDDYYIFFVDEDYGYVENEEDCDENNNLYNED